MKVGTALIATMAALVLSLLISSANNSRDRMNDELVANAARAISLDRALADYGPETKEIRALLQRSYAARIEMLFPSDRHQMGKEDTPESVLRTENIRAKLWQLSPKDGAQRGLRSEALELAGETSGLFAPRNVMVVAALFVCSLSVCGTILLILEVNSPFRGLMKLSSLPMRDALANLGQ